jgi:hypothetical protein
MLRIKFLVLLGGMACACFQANATQSRCANGAPYTLSRVFVEVEGKSVQAYEYEGPIGKGFVVSSVNEATAKEHVCLEAGRKRWLADDNRED